MGFECSLRSAARPIALLAVLAVAGDAQGQTQCNRSGPDVIVGALNGVANWGTVGDITAFSIGTTSCNVGNEELLWISSEPLHPVIGQNMYRLKDGRMEQIGMSWLKHGFFALSENLCGCGCQATSGSALGIGCSDPYTAGLNGNQAGFGAGGLGPRFQVNATTGEFSFPYAFQGDSGNAIFKRLQVHNVDLDPELNDGALYFVEGHYVTPDDAAAGNKNNNASYQRVNVFQTINTFTINLVGSTERETPAIQAWADNEFGVIVRPHDDPEGGRFLLASKCTENGDKTYHYEYALFNMNSHRSAQSFRIAIPDGVTVTNVGFHDVDYHSGEPYNGADWTGVVDAGALTWSTVPFSANQNANALRWGTLYNFRFDADSAPQNAAATIGYFRPGLAPNEGAVQACTPSISPNICLLPLPPEPPSADTHAASPKNRYLSMLPRNPGLNTSLRVTLVSSTQFPEAVGAAWWVGEPRTYCENGGQVEPPCDVVTGVPFFTFQASRLQCEQHCRDWGALGPIPIHIADINIVPDAVYEVRAVACGCDPSDPANFSVPLAVGTSKHGDTSLSCEACPCGEPEGAVNIVDCVGVVARFVNASCAPIKSRVDLEPAVPDHQINITDVARCLEAFSGVPYSFPEPAGCVP